MKKLISVGFMILACSGCQLENQPATLSDMWQQKNQAPQAVSTTTDVTTPIAATSAAKYASDADRYRQNIVLKAAGDTYVTYEYSDVRIDDVATLASAYCFENAPGLKAYLRDIYMYRNNKRRATFDCVNLASD